MVLCCKLIRFVNIANTCSFLPAFLQREKTHSSKPKSLLRHLPSFALNSRKFLLQQFVPTYFHIYIEKLLDDTCVESVSWRCYQTIHYLRGHHVPIYQLKHEILISMNDSPSVNVTNRPFVTVVHHQCVALSLITLFELNLGLYSFYLS